MLGVELASSLATVLSVGAMETFSMLAACPVCPSLFFTSTSSLHTIQY